MLDSSTVLALWGESCVMELPSTIQGRLEKAKSLKQEGNELFRAKEWKKAIKKYHHTLMYCKGITDKLDFIPGLAAAGGLRATDEEERIAREVTVAVTNNLAGMMCTSCKEVVLTEVPLLCSVLFLPGMWSQKAHIVIL